MSDFYGHEPVLFPNYLTVITASLPSFTIQDQEQNPLLSRMMNEQLSFSLVHFDSKERVSAQRAP